MEQAGSLAAYTLGIMVLGLLSWLSYSRGNPVLFMISAGIYLMVGLYSPDALKPLGYYTFGISIGLMLIFYSFVCIGLSYGNLFKNKTLDAEEE